MMKVEGGGRIAPGRGSSYSERPERRARLSLRVDARARRSEG